MAHRLRGVVRATGEGALAGYGTGAAIVGGVGAAHDAARMMGHARGVAASAVANRSMAGDPLAHGSQPSMPTAMASLQAPTVARPTSSLSCNSNGGCRQASGRASRPPAWLPSTTRTPCLCLATQTSRATRTSSPAVGACPRATPWRPGASSTGPPRKHEQIPGPLPGHPLRLGRHQRPKAAPRAKGGGKGGPPPWARGGPGPRTAARPGRPKPRMVNPFD